MPKVVITGASGKLGGAVLRNLLSYKLISADEIVVATSSQPGSDKWTSLAAAGDGITVRHATYDDPATMVAAFAGCERLLLVSSPRISMDFDDAEYGSGREAHHFAAVRAAREAGVKHIYYTSLGFSHESKSGVMKAHNRTEGFLQMLSDTRFTILREGLYNESWPLYFGHYLVGKDERNEIVVAGDGRISWAAIDDLGLATAHVLVHDPQKYSGVLVTLSGAQNRPLSEVAEMVSKVTGKQFSLKVVPRAEHERYYVEERGMDEAYVKWWAKTYDSLRNDECENKDATLEMILSQYGRKPKPLMETVQEMFKGE